MKPKLPEPMNALAKLESATRMLAECRTPQDAKKVADLAAAAGEYAKRAKLGEEAQRYAAEIRIDALTLMGELLAATPKAKGGGDQKSSDRKITGRYQQPVIDQPTLKQIGITKDESQQAQALAKAKEDDPALHEAARNGDVSIKQVASRLAKHPVESEEDKFYRTQIFFMSDWMTFAVDRLRGLIDNPEGRLHIVERLDRGATKEPDRNLWLTPDKIEAFGQGMVELAKLWRQRDWQKTRKAA